MKFLEYSILKNFKRFSLYSCIGFLFVSPQSFAESLKMKLDDSLNCEILGQSSSLDLDSDHQRLRILSQDTNSPSQIFVDNNEIADIKTPLHSCVREKRLGEKEYFFKIRCAKKAVIELEIDLTQNKGLLKVDDLRGEDSKLGPNEAKIAELTLPILNCKVPSVVSSSASY